MTVDFAHEDQRLMGYRTLNLLNVNGDATFARPILYNEIAQKYLPAAKANYARVVINGEDWGVYVNVEQFNADFIQARFGTRRGARWKVPGSPIGQGGMAYLGDDAEKYKFIYEIKTNDNAASWRSLIAFFKVLNETPLDRLEAALAPVLDVDGALKFLALENAFVNTDGYWTRASDYNIYLDERGRFHVIPHDTNEAFEEENFGAGPGRGFPPGMAPPGFPPPPGARRRRARPLRASRPCRPGWRSRPISAAPRWNWIRSSASTTRRSRSGRGCWRCPRCGRGIWATSAKSPRSGWIGARWSRWCAAISGSSPRTSRPTPRSCTASRRSSPTSPRAKTASGASSNGAGHFCSRR